MSKGPQAEIIIVFKDWVTIQKVYELFDQVGLSPKTRYPRKQINKEKSLIRSNKKKNLIQFSVLVPLATAGTWVEKLRERPEIVPEYLKIIRENKAAKKH